MIKNLWLWLYVTIQICCAFKGIAGILQADPWGVLMVCIGVAGILRILPSRKTLPHYLSHQRQIIVKTK